MTDKKDLWAQIQNLIILLVLLAGAALLAYPTVSDWYNSNHQTRAILDYDTKMEKLDPMLIRQLKAAAVEYNKSLLPMGDKRFRVAEKEGAADYAAALDPVSNGSMGYLKIPSIGVQLQIFHGTEEKVLQKAVGHMAGSSLPVGGESTHAILTGHRGLPSARLFTDIGRLGIGDRFMLSVLGEDLWYEVDSISIVLPDEMDGLAIVPGEDLVTLVTCTPYGINSHRMLIRGHRVEPDEEPVTLVADATRIPARTVAACMTVPAVAAAVLLVLL